jgi:O-antigen/teichoic acid export membrane protein
VMWSWAGHAVFIATGFVMPRFIDGHLGQTSLGIWDFGWSIVSYFGLAEIGIGSSVNRYVAKYRAVKDTEALRRTVSSVNCFQIVSGCVILIVTSLVVWRFSELFGARLADRTGDARWILAFLGASIAIQTAFDSFRGVITGCHRWDLHNSINAGSQALTTVAMMVAISAGGGLPTLAAVYFCGTVLTEVTRFMVARRVCPELLLRWRYVSVAEIRTLVLFGGKTVVDGLSKLLLYQANNIFVVGHLGAAALAVYARSLALTRHAEVITAKLSFVITPAASSLKSRGRSGDLRDLFLSGTRYGAFVALPLVLYLGIMGDRLVQVWMGPRYDGGWVLPILALGMLLPLIVRPAQHVLIGLNMHGRVGIASLIVAIVSTAAAYSMIGRMEMGLVGAALAISVPLSIGNGVFVCLYACRKLDISLRDYVKALRTPLGCGVPFAFALVATRWTSDFGPITTLTIGTAIGAAILGPCYWAYALPTHLKRQLAAYARSRCA